MTIKLLTPQGDNGEPTGILEWSSIDWPSVVRNVHRLQTRCYKALKRDNRSAAAKIQSLILGSFEAKLLAVRLVTELNHGRSTPGVDGFVPRSDQDKMRLARCVEFRSPHSALRRREIPKPGSSETRPLSIPTIYDRVRQQVVRLVMEPFWEVLLDVDVYGFRPGRSTWDAILKVRGNIDKAAEGMYVLDADIEKFFDRVDSDFLLEAAFVPRHAQGFVRSMLRAPTRTGGVCRPKPDRRGIPQGGPLSPLLANVALHGMKAYVHERIGTRFEIDGRSVRIRPPAFAFYADDFVVVHQYREVLDCCSTLIDEFLAVRGLNLHAGKTSIRHTLEPTEHAPGLDFLGFNLVTRRVGRHQTQSGRGLKTFVTPSLSSRRKHRQALREILRDHRHGKVEDMILRLNGVIRGWTGYFRHCRATKAFQSMDFAVYQMLFQWCVKHHPRQGKRWIYRKYWCQGRLRVFSDGEASLVRHTDTHIVEKRKVRSAQSPYDGDSAYWSRRRAK